MTVGRAISPECSTDERREWQKEAAALATIHNPVHVYHNAVQ
jgi:hypothetical protein